MHTGICQLVCSMCSPQRVSRLSFRRSVYSLETTIRAKTSPIDCTHQSTRRAMRCSGHPGQVILITEWAYTPAIRPGSHHKKHKTNPRYIHVRAKASTAEFPVPPVTGSKEGLRKPRATDSRANRRNETDRRPCKETIPLKKEETPFHKDRKIVYRPSRTPSHKV